MNDVRSAQGAGWRGRARGKQSCALPGAPPAGDPALGAAGATGSPARCRARTAAWGGAAPSAGEPRAKFAALGPGRPGPPRPASAPGVRAPAASGERPGREEDGLRAARPAERAGDVAPAGTWLWPPPPPPGRAAPPRASFFSFHLLGGSAGDCLSSQPAAHSFATHFRVLGGGVEAAQVKPEIVQCHSGGQGLSSGGGGEAVTC